LGDVADKDKAYVRAIVEKLSETAGAGPSEIGKGMGSLFGKMSAAWCRESPNAEELDADAQDLLIDLVLVYCIIDIYTNASPTTPCILLGNRLKLRIQ
jgi:hypothetical protein